MPELRLNLIAKEWVIIAVERAKRPEEFRQRKDKINLPEHDMSCPFCPGNEDKAPGEIMRTPAADDWKIRVVPNKFPALIRQGNRMRINNGLQHLVTGVGRHEVIIESPFHNSLLALMPTDHITDILTTYQERFFDIHNDPEIEHVIIFKNHGTGAGTSLRHPHSQIVGTPVIPIQVRERYYEAERYFDRMGECLMCATIAAERSEGKRVLVESEHFFAFIPYAALSPFHTWIFPKRHVASYGDTRSDEKTDLAYCLKTVLSKLYYGLDDPDFNYVIRSECPRECGSETFHWYISIVPRVMQTAGFELGSGMFINTALPEESAAFLRGVKV